MPAKVMRLLICTIFFLPSLSISTAAGTERRKNQMNTIDGISPATVSLSEKSAFA